MLGLGPTVRSSRPEVFLWKDVLIICSKFTGEYSCRSAISIKLQNTSGRLLLNCYRDYKFCEISKNTFYDGTRLVAASVSHKFKFFLFKLFFSFHIRSSRPEGFCIRRVLKNFAKFTGKHLCWSLFLINLQAKPATLLKIDSNTGVFLWILRDFKERLRWLLLTYVRSLLFIYIIFL